MSAGRELRIQQFLAQCGICSRRKAEVLLRNGHVSINGRVITEPGTKIVPGVDRVCVCGKPVARETAKLYAFHKPRGVVSTLNDPQGRPCVGEYVRSFPLRLFLVGRLDFDVCGLLLLTNDGKLADELLHPRHEVERVYW
ncbi:MAG TPA: S4 domain-containing protein, partial [Oligoflexia bacterium]|nr:S4 domain-containing protein [Oligoflexia bacterium]